MKLNVPIGQKVHFAGVSPIFSLTADHRVFGIGDRTQAEQCLVEIGQAREVIGANVHVVKLEIHCAFHLLNHETFPVTDQEKNVGSVNWICF